MKANIFLLQVLLLLLGVKECVGGIRWDSQEQSVHASLESTETIATFKFKNTGNQNIKVTALRPACVCCKAVTSAEEVKPGEEGEVTITYYYGSHVGKQIKPVAVETNDSQCPVTILTLIVYVPRVLETESAPLQWPINKTPEEKRVVVKIANGVPAQNIGCRISEPGFEVRIQKTNNPTEFDVFVRPANTEHWISSVLEIYPDTDLLRPRVSQIPLLVN